MSELEEFIVERYVRGSSVNTIAQLTCKHCSTIRKFLTDLGYESDYEIKRRQKQIVKLNQQGVPIDQIAIRMGVSKRTIYRVIEKEEARQ